MLLVAGAVATLVITLVVEARYPPTGRFVAVPGGKVAIVEAGPRTGGPGTVVLLHGASSNAADMMSTLGRRLAADGFRVVAVDRPGLGWSDRVRGGEAASPAVQGDVISSVLGQLDIRGAIVVGHSWSGALAIDLALDHAERVGGLVLLAPVTHPWPGGAISPVYRTAAAGWLGALMTRTITAPVGAALFESTARAVFAPEAMPAGYIDGADLPLVLRPSSFLANAQDVGRLNDFVAVQSLRHDAIRVPTTIVAGDADRIVRTERHARRLAAEVAGANLVIVPGAGHMIHQTAVPTIAAEVRAMAARMHDQAPE